MEKQINLDVIDQFYSALLSANESKERMEELHEDVELAVQELMRQQGKSKNWTGTIPYHGFKIVVSRPKSYTWEQNNQIDDPQIAYYKAMSKQYDDLNTQLKAKRKEMKGIAETLAIKYPDSESIKYGFTVAFLR